MAKLVFAVSFLSAGATLSWSFIPGHAPGWNDPSTAERLIHAEAVVLARADALVQDRAVVEEVLRGPPEVGSAVLAVAFPDIIGRGGVAPHAGHLYLLIVSRGEGGVWYGDFPGEALPHDVSRKDGAAVRVARRLLALQDAPDLTKALRAEWQAAAPVERRLWQQLLDDHVRSASPYRPFPELKAMFEAPADGATRARALDAMCKHPYREALPLMRAVLAEANDLDTVPAAIRCAVAFQDHDALPSIVRLYPTLVEDNERWSEAYLRASSPSSSYEDFLRFERDYGHYLKTGRMRFASLVIDAFLCLARRDDDTRALDMLRYVRSSDAWQLAQRFFRIHPRGRALTILRNRARGEFGDENRGLTRALALLGDADVVVWAAEETAEPGVPPGDTEDDVQVALSVLGLSPLPRAAKVVEQVLAAGGERAGAIQVVRQKVQARICSPP